MIPRGLIANSARPTPTGPTGPAIPGGTTPLTLSKKQRNVVVERFRDWLDFPARVYDARQQTILERRDGEETPTSEGGAKGRNASQRRDTRLDRLKPVQDRLGRTGFAGPLGLDFLRALVETRALSPSDILDYPELDLTLLHNLGLLPR